MKPKRGHRSFDSDDNNNSDDSSGDEPSDEYSEESDSQEDDNEVEEGRKSKKRMTSSGNSHGAGDNSDAVEFISVEELNKLRSGGNMDNTEKKKPVVNKDVQDNGEEDVNGNALAGYVSVSELKKLRQDDIQRNGREEDDDDPSAKSARERGLDIQYYESDDKEWACISVEERLPADRALVYSIYCTSSQMRE